MKLMNKILFNNDKNITSQSVIWNLIASLLNAIISAYMLMIVTRYIGIKEGGIIAIAATLAYQLLIIGNYGMRNYQATDTKRNYSFTEYLYSRYITSILMILAMFIIVFYNGYNMHKSLVIIGFVLFKWVDAIEDVYHGFYQQNNRLDVGGREQSYRYVFSLIVFTVATIITKDIVISCMLTFILSLLFFVIVNHYIKKHFKLETKVIKKNIYKLLMDCFPLFISTYLYLYICNAPKYAIDTVSTDVIQSYFGVIFMPVFIINLISTLIYRPILTNMAEKWNSNKHKFLMSVYKQIGIIVALTVLAVIGAYLLGTQVLGFVYKMDLSSYKTELCLLMIGGGFNAFIGYMLSVITIIRSQKSIIFGYIFVALISFFFSNGMIKNYEIMGAALLYLILTVTLGLYFIIIFILKFNNKKQNKTK